MTLQRIYHIIHIFTKSALLGAITCSIIFISFHNWVSDLWIAFVIPFWIMIGVSLIGLYAQWDIKKTIIKRSEKR